MENHFKVIALLITISIFSPILSQAGDGDPCRQRQELTMVRDLVQSFEEILAAHAQYASANYDLVRDFVESKNAPFIEALRSQGMTEETIQITSEYFKNTTIDQIKKISEPTTMTDGTRMITLVPELHTAGNVDSYTEFTKMDPTSRDYITAEKVAQLIISSKDSKIFVEDPYVVDDITSNAGLHHWRRDWVGRVSQAPLGIIGKIPSSSKSISLRKIGLKNVYPLEPQRENYKDILAASTSLDHAQRNRRKMRYKLCAANGLRRSVCKIPVLGSYLQSRLPTQNDLASSEAACKSEMEKYSQALTGKSEPGETDSTEARSQKMAEILSSAEGLHAWAIMGANHVPQVIEALSSKGWRKIDSPTVK